ncbi:hypothetical protein [Catellatospora tritici]|uniref:hypothetical protein n=1 Tax=Catellatospora tritici TaxID=2851566 RepID=UPI001C2DA537|nr:hypothetical protein [Catellatospora tritici]MBV1852348.1 hypothetical protein [Catellatospora tritici]
MHSGRISDAQAAGYRRMLRDHTPDPASPQAGCPICHRHRCADYRYAFGSLAVAGRSTAVNAPPSA